ncbi:Histone-lysine N-methyltransferase setd3 [Amphibalanus amphitrite]|uniref:protein-histidine N-methyltransferase n=1 Tax=Amphibalanus amphitrite TaxID=1232801 RepID=A0A6A4VHF9_AMPAM|nr:Histone-lysine N-methyltransferase setd3 [Amphibalanus amphitrite]
MADTTTEWCGIRLYLSNSALKSSSPAPTLDIHNFYRPPIRPGEEGQRSNYFDLSDPKPWAMDPELEEAVSSRSPGSTDARDRWVEAKRRTAEVEEEAKARSFRNFATEELNWPANIGTRTTTGWRDRGREALARVGRGGAALTFEALLATAGPPWRDVPGVTIALEVGPGGRRDRHPDTRREAAENRLAELPAEATWIWSAGFATDGVLDGRGGATIIRPNGDVREQTVPSRLTFTSSEQDTSGSAQYLHRMGRRLEAECPQCNDVGCSMPRLPRRSGHSTTPPARPGGGPGSRLARVQELHGWLLQQGGRAPGLEAAEFAGYGLGLRCTEPLAPCQTAIQVPRAAMLSLDTARQAKIGPFIAGDKLTSAMPQLGLTLHLLEEALSEDSCWTAYIRALPDTYDTVLYFTPAEVEMLRGSPCFEEALKQCRNIARQYAYYYGCLHVSTRQIARDTVPPPVRRHVPGR